jgi:hypothetical protein
MVRATMTLVFKLLKLAAAATAILTLLLAVFLYTCIPLEWYALVYGDGDPAHVTMQIPEPCIGARWGDAPGSDAAIWCNGYSRVVNVQKNTEMINMSISALPHREIGTYVAVRWMKD